MLCYGKSTERLIGEQLQAERAGILLDAVKAAKELPGINPDWIGVWGISQAGYVIPRAQRDYKRALEKANNLNYKIELIEGADHNIIIFETGCERERACRTRAEWSNYNPEFLKIMEQWLKDLNK